MVTSSYPGTVRVRIRIRARVQYKHASLSKSIYFQSLAVHTKEYKKPLPCKKLIKQPNGDVEYTHRQNSITKGSPIRSDQSRLEWWLLHRGCGKSEQECYERTAKNKKGLVYHASKSCLETTHRFQILASIEQYYEFIYLKSWLRVNITMPSKHANLSSRSFAKQCA